MTSTQNKLMTFGNTVNLLERSFAAYGDSSSLTPHYDSEAGEYDNIGDWLAMKDDGLVYGVRIPKYSYSPLTTAAKTGANAGMVLEPSSESTAGRNDYKGIALFMCPRCNATVDTSGIPHVTAIEGYDDRFDETLNTYAITPVYYKKETDEGNYILKEYSFTPRTGFKACRGAYTTGGTLREFILRACFMDSAGDFSSKAGTQPAAKTGTVTAVEHCSNNDFTWSKSRGSTDGLTYLDYGDITWREEFMELMLGYKSPRAVAVGCVSYNLQYAVEVGEEGVKRVLLTDAQAGNILVGSIISIGSYSAGNVDRAQSSMHDIAKNAKVLSKTALGNSYTALNLDLASNITVEAGYRVSTMPWRNGCCSGVLGTFGSPTSAGLTNGKEPFRFQNVECMLGLYEVVHNMHSYNSVTSDVQKHEWYIAADVANCTSNDQGTGWTKLTQDTVAASQNAWNYIEDYKTERGARVPANVGGTSSTGHKVAWHPGATTAQARETLVGGALDHGATAGVGCVNSNLTLSGAAWSLGGRSSAIGHSALAE